MADPAPKFAVQDRVRSNDQDVGMTGTIKAIGEYDGASNAWTYEVNYTAGGDGWWLETDMEANPL